MPTAWVSTVTGLAVPTLPAFYIYAIYRKQFGDLEFRTNRVLSTYSFLLLYVTAFTLIYSAGIRFVPRPEDTVLYGLIIFLIFVAAAPSLRTRYNQVFGRLAYGTSYNPEAIVRTFAGQIPTVGDRKTLIRVLQDDVTPSLLIRQSALCLLGDRDASVLYTQGVTLSPSLELAEAAGLLKETHRYRPAVSTEDGPFEWVRLALPLTVREKTIGVWLFGRRDPDDYYPRSDIDLLDALASQVALALQNAQLFEEASRRTAQQEALNAVISTAAAVPGLEELIEVALEHTLNALDLEMGAAWLEQPRIFRGRGLPAEYGQAPTQAILTVGMEPARTTVVEDWSERLENHPQPPHQSVPPDLGVHASVNVAIQSEGRTMGGLALVSAKPRRWTSEEVSLAEAIGGQMGGAVERLQLLDQIQRQARQLQRILETVQEGIFTLDSDRRILLANPAARESLQVLTNVGEGQVLHHLGGRTIAEFLVPRSDGLPHEIRLNDAAQHVFEVLATQAPGDNPERGWTMLIREVTEVRRAQSRVHQQDRLAAVGQLAAGIAHDFNNIMNAIILFSEMLLQEPNLTAKGSERLTTIIQQAQRATTLTRQILDFGRQTIMDIVPVDMAPFLKEFAKLLDRTLPENIRLSVNIEDDTFMVRGDPGRLQQVFMNLALNARDAMTSGGELRFKVDRWTLQAGQRALFRNMPEGNWVRIQVMDTGMGIPAEVLPHIFEPFFTTKPPGHGTGLGLAQVYGIVKQHNGYIDVTSQPGEGTTFLIFLPALEVSQPVMPLIEQGLPSHGSHETILVVEDEEATRDAVCEILEALNYEVLVAKNGREALALFNEGAVMVDLVLSDLVMPEMGGLALYKELQQQSPGLRMILMTGYPLGKNTRTLLDQEHVTWVQKPLNSEMLARIVREALENLHAGKSVRRLG